MEEIKEMIQSAISSSFVPNLIDREKALKFLKAINDTEERINIAIRLLIKLFGTDDYEINYIIGILNGDRQIHFDELKKEVE